jgi:MarR family 2-MHQ and catechol resistance regulon transcriptional repressor
MIYGGGRDVAGADMGTKHKGSKAEVRALDAYIKMTRANESLGARLTLALGKSELTHTQFGTLEVLHHLGPMCQKDLGKKLLKSGGNVTLVVDNLEKRGLVERQRDTRDRRFVTVHLTDEGRALIERIFPEHALRIVEAFRSLSAGEQEQLGELAKKLGLGLSEDG